MPVSASDMGSLWTCPLGLHPINSEGALAAAPSFLPAAPARNASPAALPGRPDPLGLGAAINGASLDADLQGPPLSLGVSRRFLGRHARRL